jgi:hypothetical protein
MQIYENVYICAMNMQNELKIKDNKPRNPIKVLNLEKGNKT